MRLALTSPLLAALLAPGLVLAEATGPDFFSITGVASDDVLNIRTSPDAHAEKIGEIPPDGTCDGQLIKLWGFVDHGNMYGDDGARAMLREWWSGYGPNDATWRFDLKANEDDETGRSMSVWVPNDPGRDAILGQFVSDARAGRSTKVFLSARIFAFDAPANILAFSGLYMELQSSEDILLELPETK